jgi:hypothetical protein
MDLKRRCWDGLTVRWPWRGSTPGAASGSSPASRGLNKPRHAHAWRLPGRCLILDGAGLGGHPERGKGAVQVMICHVGEGDGVD